MLPRTMKEEMEVSSPIFFFPKLYIVLFLMSQDIMQMQKWLFTDDQRLKSKNLSYGNLYNAIETSSEKLTMEKLQESHEPCFDRFLSLKKLMHQVQLIQLLRLFTIKCKDNKVLEFNLGGIDARFAK